MDTSLTRSTAAIRVIGATLVIAALLVGALLGRAVSPGAPAHADLVEEQTLTCTTCSLTQGGSGGGQPGIPAISGSGQGGNTR